MNQRLTITTHHCNNKEKIEVEAEQTVAGRILFSTARWRHVTEICISAISVAEDSSSFRFLRVLLIFHYT